MSFYGTPLKHGKGVNKPFRSPLIKSTDQNDGTPKKPSTSSKLNQSLRVKSLGLTSRRFNSPMKPVLASHSITVEAEIHTECVGNSTAIKRIDYSSPLKRIENNLFLNEPRHKILKLSHDNSVQPSETNLEIKQLENSSPVKLNNLLKTTKNKNSSTNVFSVEEILIHEEEVDIETVKEKLPEKKELSKTPPVSPNIQQITKSPEYQPVVKLERLNPNMTDIRKQDFDLLKKRIKDKKRQMVELRAQVPTTKKHNLEEIVMSIGKWREAFAEALETLRESLTEKNGRYFSTSDILKLLSIPSNIVYFSEEQNDYIFSKT